MATALALRYARAFADVAEEARLDSTRAQSQIGDFAGTVGDSRDLRELLENPSIEQASKLKVLDAIAARLGMFPQVRNFLAVVLDHGRLADLNEILAHYREIADADSGSVEAKITTARALDEAGRAELEAQVTRMAGAKVRATYAQDASLLGGAVVEIGSTIYDGSVRAQLQQLKQQLVSA